MLQFWGFKETGIPGTLEIWEFQEILEFQEFLAETSNFMGKKSKFFSFLTRKTEEFPRF